MKQKEMKNLRTIYLDPIEKSVAYIRKTNKYHKDQNIQFKNKENETKSHQTKLSLRFHIDKVERVYVVNRIMCLTVEPTSLTQRINLKTLLNFVRVLFGFDLDFLIPISPSRIFRKIKTKETDA